MEVVHREVVHRLKTSYSNIARWTLIRLDELRLRGSPGFLSDRRTWFVAGIVALNLLIIGGMWLLSSGAGSGGKSSSTRIGEVPTLEQAYQQALKAAQDWQADAQVVGVSTAWRLASGDELSLYRPAWSFSFYSPTAGQVQIVGTDPRGALPGPQQPAPVAPQPVAADWGLDSDTLLLTFLGHGGEGFLGAHPDANIHAQLRAEGPDGALWTITAVDLVTGQSLMVGVDALTRQVVFSKPSEGGK
jgi:hypothetical protein